MAIGVKVCTGGVVREVNDIKAGVGGVVKTIKSGILSRDSIQPFYGEYLGTINSATVYSASSTALYYKATSSDDNVLVPISASGTTDFSGGYAYVGGSNKRFKLCVTSAYSAYLRYNIQVSYGLDGGSTYESSLTSFMNHYPNVPVLLSFKETSTVSGSGSWSRLVQVLGNSVAYGGNGVSTNSSVSSIPSGTPATIYISLSNAGGNNFAQSVIDLTSISINGQTIPITFS